MGKSRNDHFVWLNIVFTCNDQTKWSNQKNIAVLPVAKPYLFDILLKKNEKAVATLTQVAPDDQNRNDHKKKLSRPFDQKNGIIFIL